MMNLRTFASVSYLSQIAFLGSNAQTNPSQLLDIVPKRDVLYVGGKYTNVTVSLTFCPQQACLTTGNRTRRRIPRLWP